MINKLYERERLVLPLGAVPGAKDAAKNKLKTLICGKICKTSTQASVFVQFKDNKNTFKF